jgi:N-acetylneuraminic acid mutarotase
LNQPRKSSSIINIVSKNGDDNLYVMGGADDRGNPIASIEYLDPGAENWQTLRATLPKKGFYSFGLFEIEDGNVLIFGGFNKGQKLKACYVFNIETQEISDHPAQLPEGEVFTNNDLHINQQAGTVKKFGMGSEHLFSYDIKEEKWELEFEF